VILSCLIERALEPPYVVANVEQNNCNLLLEKGVVTLQDNTWINDNFLNLVIHQMVHFQASPTYTGRLAYLYDT
jgi:hypothetical protein